MGPPGLTGPAGEPGREVGSTRHAGRGRRQTVPPSVLGWGSSPWNPSGSAEASLTLRHNSAPGTFSLVLFALRGEFVPVLPHPRVKT